MSARTYGTKGIVYGLILGIVELALNLASLATGRADVGVNLAMGLISSLIFGYVLGYSYERFAPRTPSTIRSPFLSNTVQYATHSAFSVGFRGGLMTGKFRGINTAQNPILC
jgi:hypothetical protein